MYMYVYTYVACVIRVYIYIYIYIYSICYLVPLPECSHDLCVNLNDEAQINTYCYV